jgi:NDP-sugar pyrophosphorylase family protein
MKAVILVGGEGTRLRPLTYDIPKPMVPIVNKPYMEHQIDYLMKHGFDEIIFALGYKSEAFEAWFGNGERFGARFWHVVEKEPLGTAGAVKNVETLLDDTFLVFNGDVLSGIDLTALVALHRERGAVGTLALTPVEDPSQYGVVVTDESGRVEAFIEKPPRGEAPSNAINAGVYVLEPSVVAAMPPGRRWMFEHNVFPDLLASGQPLHAGVSDAYWLDIGSPQRYLQANYDVLEGRAGVALPGPASGPWLGAGARISPEAQVRGPVWLGEGAEVEAGAMVEGPTVLGPRCRVGGGARLVGSTIWADTTIEARASIERGLVGRNCVVGAGAVLEEEAVLGSGQRVEAGQRVERQARIPS